MLSEDTLTSFHPELATEREREGERWREMNNMAILVFWTQSAAKWETQKHPAVGEQNMFMNV